MVYCGKASQGCQNCRTRRIKCDKKTPECTQCTRVGKKCPGYRDQLSLMFRDESDKVIQKAHAQWGIGPGESSSAGSSSAVPSLTSDDESPISAASWSVSPVTPASASADATRASLSSLQARKAARRHVPAVRVKQEPGEDPPGLIVLHPKGRAPMAAKVPRGPDPTLDDKSIAFYVNRFMVGQPDQAITPVEVQMNPGNMHPLLLDMMSAIGLTAMFNLYNDSTMLHLAHNKYGSIIPRTASISTTQDVAQAHVFTRTVVMLALFEVVKGTSQANSSAMTHIQGAAAFLQTFLRRSTAPSPAVRGLLQLGNTMFIPCYTSGIPLPRIFYDSIDLSNSTVGQYDPYDRPATELTVYVSRFVQMSAQIRRLAFVDGHKTTSHWIQQAILLDARFEEWEKQQQGKWRFGKVSGHPTLPAAAAFRNQLHVYEDQWIGRNWNHYRWARILVNEMLLNFVETCPMSSLPLISAARRAYCLSVIKRLAEDILISVPTHWRHPSLNTEQRKVIQQTSGGAGVGAAGIPSLLHQIKVAGCAPGVPYEFWQWAVSIEDTVWSELGMKQARSLSEMMTKHRDRLKLVQPDAILNRGPLAPQFKMEHVAV